MIDRCVSEPRAAMLDKGSAGRPRVKEGEMKRWGLFLTMSLTVSLVLLPGVSSAEDVAGWNALHTVKSEMMEVGDIPGHFVGVSVTRGIAYYTKGPDKGAIIPRMGTSTFDVVNGKGTVTGYEVKTFNDGSTIDLKWSGTLTPADGGKRSTGDGTWDLAGGTGRFAGAKGSGTWKSERVGDMKSGGDVYNEWSGAITMK